MGGFKLTLLLAFLVHTKRIGARAAPHSAFRVILTYIRDEFTEGTVLAGDEHVGTGAKLVLQVGGPYNALGHVSPTALAEVQTEAAHSLRYFTTPPNPLALDTSELFHHLFLHKRKFEHRFDLAMHIPIHQHLDLGRVQELPRRLLGDRINLLCPGPTMEVTYPARGATSPQLIHHGTTAASSEQPPLYGSCTQKCIVLGINVNNEVGAAWRLVDRGPPAESIQEALEFKQLWGDKVSGCVVCVGDVRYCVFVGMGVTNPKRTFCFEKHTQLYKITHGFAPKRMWKHTPPTQTKHRQIGF